MSRGLGRIERLIIEVLTPRRKGHVPRLLARDLAFYIYRTALPAQRASVYQALASLERKGILASIKGADPRSVKSWSLAEAQRAEIDRQRELNAKKARKEQEKARKAQKERAKTVEQPTVRPKVRTSRTRLIHLLGMLGSDHDGEIVSAARKIEEERRRLGLSWSELIEPPASWLHELLSGEA